MLPNPHLAALEPLIGAWTTVGHHSMLPDLTLHGRMSCEWDEGGAFIQMRTEMDEPQIPSGIAIFGTDDETGALTMLYFDERTVSRRYEAAIEGKVLRWWRMTPDFSQRYALTIDPSGDSLHSAGELSKDGKTWDPDLELSYSRTK
jgi:hypothetical protein